MNKKTKKNKKTKTKKIKRPVEKRQNILVYSALFFATNILTALYKKLYVYAALFYILTITSIIVHSTYCLQTDLIDKVSVFLIVLYGGSLMYSKMTLENIIPIILIKMAFLLCVFLYVYGLHTKQFCFHPKKSIGNKYHAILHAISSIGHHFIAFLQ